MDEIDMWLDDQTLRNLKSISRKLVSLGKPSLSEEELQAVKKIEHRKDLPPHVLKHFLANGLTPDIPTPR